MSSARAFGSGTVSFGLVSIPIKIYTTSKPGSAISFNMVHADCGTKVKQQYVCPKDNEIVPREKMAKGYEYEKGKYVVLSTDEVKALEAVSDNCIALEEFVPADSVDPIYIEKSYYLGPDKGGDRAYALLSRALRDTGLVGIARYSARGKEYMVLVRPHGEYGISMCQMRFEDEVRSFDEVPVGELPDIADAELDLAIKLVQQIAHDEFHPENYSDSVKERVKALIQQKIDGKEIEVEVPTTTGEIIDLMAALKASLGMAADAPAKGEAKKPEAKKAEAKKAEAKKPAAGRKKAAKAAEG